jgi:hypothetical protein
MPLSLLDTKPNNAMTDQELKDLVASLAVAQAKTDEQLAKTDAQMAKTDAQLAKTGAKLDRLAELYGAASGKQDTFDTKLDRLAELYGGVSSNQGSAAEEFFYNSLSANPVLGDIKFDRVSANVNVSTKKKQAEFDIVMLNGSSVAVIEVKYKVHPADLEKAEKTLKRYREFYPEHKSYALYGGIAGFSVPPDVVKAAKEKGLIVLKRKGDVLTADAKGMRTF